MHATLETPGLRLRAFRLEDLDAYAAIGRAGFIDPPDWPAFEPGWVLGKRYWGRGYATEAARCALDHAFGALGRDRHVSLIRPGNAASIRVAERIGERHVGEVELLGSPALVYEARRP